MRVIRSLAWLSVLAPSLAVAQAPSSFVFTDAERVSGTRVAPDTYHLEVQRPVPRTGLVKIREHFVPELVRSAESL